MPSQSHDNGLAYLHDQIAKPRIVRLFMNDQDLGVQFRPRDYKAPQDSLHEPAKLVADDWTINGHTAKASVKLYSMHHCYGYVMTDQNGKTLYRAERFADAPVEAWHGIEIDLELDVKGAPGQ